MDKTEQGLRMRAAGEALEEANRKLYAARDAVQATVFETSADDAAALRGAVLVADSEREAALQLFLFAFNVWVQE